MASRKVTSTEQTLSNGSLVSKEQLVTQRLQNQDKSLMPTTVFILMHVLDYELWIVCTGGAGSVHSGNKRTAMVSQSQQRKHPDKISPRWVQ